MSCFNVREVSLSDVASADSQGLLRAFGKDTIELLITRLGASDLATIIALPPKGMVLSSAWWLGESHDRWSAHAGSDKRGAQRVVQAIHKSGVDYKKLPLQLVTLGGWYLHARASEIPNWDAETCLTATIPVGAIEPAIQTIQESAGLLSDGLQASRSRGRTFDAAVTKALPIVSEEGANYRTMYARPGEAEMSQQVWSSRECSSQKAFLSRAMDALETLESKAKGTAPLTVMKTRDPQFLLFLNALEFDRSLEATVRAVNRRRAMALVWLQLPQFYSALTVRGIEVGNEPKRKYRCLPNDHDWMTFLLATSPQSFSEDQAELDCVGEYLTALKKRYPCLRKDPLKGNLSIPTVTCPSW